MKLDRFKFSEDYLVDVADIDRQHATFFDIYNQIADRLDCDSPLSRREFRALANQLFMYAKYHFKEESWIMATYSYPTTREHLDQHEFLINCIDSVAMTDVDDLTLTQVIANFVQAWSEHILVMDKGIGEYMNNRLV